MSDVVRISAEHAEEIGLTELRVEKDGYVTLTRSEYLTVLDAQPEPDPFSDSRYHS